MSYWPVKLNISIYLFIYFKQTCPPNFPHLSELSLQTLELHFLFFLCVSNIQLTLSAALLLPGVGLSFLLLSPPLHQRLLHLIHFWMSWPLPGVCFLCLHCLSSSQPKFIMFQTVDINLLQNHFYNIIFLLKYLLSILYPWILTDFFVSCIDLLVSTMLSREVYMGGFWAKRSRVWDEDQKTWEQEAVTHFLQI